MNTEALNELLQLNALEKEFQKFLNRQWKTFRQFVIQQNLASRGTLGESVSILALLATFYRHCLRQFKRQISHSDLSEKEQLSFIYSLQKSFREIVKKAEIVKTSFEVEGEIEYG